MAKRRHLKKEISFVTGELFVEVLVSKMLIPSVDNDRIDALLERTLDMQDKFISKVNGLNNKDCAKEYFRKLEEDLQSEVDAIADEIGRLNEEKAGE